jgi:uncharacterized protein DUF6328
MMTHQAREELPISKAVALLLEECRMVLPGLQALFGFQLVAVFNSGFEEILTDSEQRLHLLALSLVVVTGALVMTPAAYHRQTTPYDVNEAFLILASRLLLWSMLPLMLGIGIDFYLIARVILVDRLMSGLLALMVIISSLWFLLPRLALVQHWLHHSR